MPPRVILDMKLEGKGSELDVLGYVGFCSSLTNIDQLLGQLLRSVLDVRERR
jgi:hypothetical protein